MTIGDFSRATRLSAKALRFYHEAGVLEPASVDPSNGYRLYDAGQIVDAQLVPGGRVELHHRFAHPADGLITALRITAQ